MQQQLLLTMLSPLGVGDGLWPLIRVLTIILLSLSLCCISSSSNSFLFSSLFASQTGWKIEEIKKKKRVSFLWASGEKERERQEDKGKGKKANPFPLVIYFLWPIITSYHVKEEIFGIRPSLPLSTDPFYYPLFFFIAQFSSFIQCEKDKKSAHQTIISPPSFFFLVSAISKYQITK